MDGKSRFLKNSIPSYFQEMWKMMCVCCNVIWLKDYLFLTHRNGPENLFYFIMGIVGRKLLKKSQNRDQAYTVKRA